MATLTFEAGPITSAITADNTKAATAFRNAAQYLGYDGDIGDNQAVSDYVMAEIRKTISGWSKQHQTRVDTEAARDAVIADDSLEFDA